MEIVLAQGSALLSRIIMKGTDYEFSHCALRYSGNDDKWMVHSSLGGVAPEWSDYFFYHYKKTKRYKVKFAIGDMALDKAVSLYRHSPYDYLGIVGCGLVLLLARFGIKIKNPLGSKRNFMCTEWVVAWLKICQEMNPSMKVKDFDSEVTTPKDLGLFFDSRKDLFEEIVEQK